MDYVNFIILVLGNVVFDIILVLGVLLMVDWVWKL